MISQYFYLTSSEYNIMHYILTQLIRNIRKQEPSFSHHVWSSVGLGLNSLKQQNVANTMPGGFEQFFAVTVLMCECFMQQYMHPGSRTYLECCVSWLSSILIG